MPNLKLKDTLLDLLKKDSRLTDEQGELRENLLREFADKYDPKLIELLMSNETTRQKFFVSVGNALIFKHNDLKFFIDENKLDNSYTQFENKIGLRYGSRLLREASDVVLNFPYKDCVLEGGQSTEEGTDTYFEFDVKQSDYVEQKAKRKEIFFNQILAKDEIDRLFEPKAFANAKNFGSNGDEKEISFTRDENGTIKDNLIIKGNNLLALHSLKEQFRGKVKLIYIDPPYNTGSDSFAYNDNFNHSTWLVFMKNRLEIARELLSDEGSIWISCDEGEEAYLKVLMDDLSLFKRENFINTITYERSGTAGIGQGGFFVDTSEYILIYGKNKSMLNFNEILKLSPIDYDVMKRYNKVLLREGQKQLIETFDSKSNGLPIKIYKHNNYELSTISLKNFDKRENEIKREYKTNFDLIFRTTNPQKENSFQQELLSKMDGELFSVEYTPSRGKNKGIPVTTYYFNNEIFAWLKETAKIEGNNIWKSNKLSTVWSNSEIPKADLANEGGVVLKRGKKPEQLLKRIIELSTNEGDIVLDYHLGSGTTAAVAHKMNRQYIGIEQLNYFENDSVVRLQNVINGDTSGISKAVNWQGGGSFIYLELAKNNQTALEKIEKAENFEELMKFFDEMYERYFLSYNLKIKEFKEKICQEGAFKNLPLERQKQIFGKMLDLNQLYVNCSDMHDARYGLSENDITTTNEFYNL